MFVPVYGYTVTEHDPPTGRESSSERATAKSALPDDASFFAWVHENWPAPRWSVEVGLLWQRAPARPR